MRPEILFPIFSSVIKLNGVGPKTSKLIEKLAGPKIRDLLWHLPIEVIDRRYSPTIADAIPGSIATMSVTVKKHINPKRRNLPYKVVCFDETGSMSLIFFHARPDYLIKMLPEGQMRVISGIIEEYDGVLQMSHPDHIVKTRDRVLIEAVQPVYRLTQGLSQKILSRTIKDAITLIPDLSEWLDKSLQKQKRWPSWKQAITIAHTPDDLYAIEGRNPARVRLAYDELLANQLALGLIRIQMRNQNGRKLIGTNKMKSRVI